LSKTVKIHNLTNNEVNWQRSNSHFVYLHIFIMYILSM